jgi:hypothetical protein
MREKRTMLRVATPPDADRAARAAAFAEECEAALRSVLAKEPLAICIVYETPTAAGYTTIPASKAIAVGLLHMASDMVCANTDVEETD